MSTTPPIKGYRPLEPEMIELMNRNKLVEELALRQLDQHTANPDCDQRWVALARTHIQIGFMALNRAVAPPGRIEGEIDIDALLKDLAQ